MITIMQLRLYSEFRLVLIGREVEVKISILDNIDIFWKNETSILDFIEFWNVTKFRIQVF